MRSSSAEKTKPPLPHAHGNVADHLVHQLHDHRLHVGERAGSYARGRTPQLMS